MRRIEQLVNDVLFNVGQNDSNRYDKYKLIKSFNDAQRLIQNVIFISDTKGKFFAKKSLLDMVADQEEYDIPTDAFCASAISYVGVLGDSSSQFYRQLDMINGSEKDISYGFFIEDTKIVLSPKPSISRTSGVKIGYIYQIPTLSPRIGRVSALTSGVSIQLGAGFTTEQITDFDDYVTVISADGTIKQGSILVDSYDVGTGLILSTTALTDVAVNDYVVIGKNATTHSKLPDICERMLTELVERKINATDSSTDFEASDYLTKEEMALIESLFREPEKASSVPPITNTTYFMG